MENKKIADIIIKQIHLFFISGLYGILLGLWYEFFRTLRKNFVHKNKMVHLEDVIFCFTAAIGLSIGSGLYFVGIAATVITILGQILLHGKIRFLSSPRTETFRSRSSARRWDMIRRRPRGSISPLWTHRLWTRLTAEF